MNTTRQATKMYIVAYRERTQKNLIEVPGRDPGGGTDCLLSGVEEVQVGLRDEREGLVTG